MTDLRVNGLGNVQTHGITGTNNTAGIKFKRQAPDSFEKKPFDIDDAMSFLSAIKTKRNKREIQKFTRAQLFLIKSALKKSPEKWEDIKKLANTPFVKAQVVAELAMTKKDVLSAMMPFALAPNAEDSKKPKYNAPDLYMMANTGQSLGAERLTSAKPLIKTALSGTNVAGLMAAEVLVGQMEKVSNKVLEMEKAMGPNLKEIVFDGNCYNPDEYIIKVLTQDGQVNTELLDKNFKRCAVENISVYQDDDGKEYQIKKVNDVRNNTVSKVRLALNGTEMPSVTNEVRVIKDNNGKVLRKEYTSESDIPGVYNVRHVDANGVEKVLSSAKYDSKTGVVSIRKNMESLDGTKTFFIYEDDPQGNRLSHYAITDKNGNKLLDNFKTFEVLSDNKFVSSKNSDRYEITVNDKEIHVQDVYNKEKQATIPIGRNIRGNKKEILKSLKAMPGEELFKLSKSTKALVGATDLLDSYFDPAKRLIHSGSDLYIVLHELGHAVDIVDVDCTNERTFDRTIHKSISENPEVQKTYDEERKAFNQAFPEAQRDHIDYFINQATHYGGESGGLIETIAESNALLTTPKVHELLGIRAQYLQQYFPKTIALLDKVLTEKGV